MKPFIQFIAIFGLGLYGTPIVAQESAPEIETIVINRRDLAAQQRGAATFFQYCAGCHSLKQMRYTDLAYKFGWVNANGDIDQNLVFEYLNFINDNASSPILTAMNPVDAENWFGKVPPDLSLVTRSRSPSWVAQFLKSFYPDSDQPKGVGNHLFESDISMPHVLIEREGWAPLSEMAKQDDLENVLLLTAHSEGKYDRVVSDLVHFLDYVGEPHRLERETMGKYVLLFLVALSCINYLYYRSVWSDLYKDEDENEGD